MRPARPDGRLKALDGPPSPRTGGARTGPRVIVFGDRDVIAHGLVGLLPDEWSDRAQITADLPELERAIPHGVTAAVIDARHDDAERAAGLIRSRGGSALVLIESIEENLRPGLLAHADAILLRDDVDFLSLRVALAAARMGMRVLPRALPPAGEPVREMPALKADDPAQRALQLLADGLRDAEIALELDLSESAVRKLIQRTVRRLGARTRCQAVAATVRGVAPGR